MQITQKAGGEVTAVIAVLILIITTILCFIPILFIGIFKLIPIKKWQSLCTRAVDAIATFWCGLNNFYINTFLKTKFDISGLENLNIKGWYLVIANHQSWLDIVILQRLFNHKIPVLKFFIKDQLKWVPFLGFAWWAMGCPFMKRYSKDYLLKNPHKQGQDLSSTRRAIENFKQTPASIMSFVEGTRFTANKKELQNSPYTHLLKPKAGGISFIISAMGEQIDGLLDVTIVYPKNQNSLWEFLCGRIPLIKLNIRSVSIPHEFKSTQLLEDLHIQQNFKKWLNEQWFIKDQLIHSINE